MYSLGVKRLTIVVTYMESIFFNYDKFRLIEINIENMLNKIGYHRNKVRSFLSLLFY